MSSGFPNRSSIRCSSRTLLIFFSSIHFRKSNYPRYCHRSLCKSISCLPATSFRLIVLHLCSSFTHAHPAILQLLSNTNRVIRNQGRRLVTAQLDGNIKFFCRSGVIKYYDKPLLKLSRITTTSPALILAAAANAGTWAEEDDKKSVAPRSAHSAPVNRVSWAHPEFGQIVSSCSNDKTVR